MFRKVVCSLLVVLSLPLVCRAQSWSTVETDHFLVYYHDTGDGDKEYAKKAGGVAEEYLKGVSKHWGAKVWSQKCGLYLHPNAGSIVAATGCPKDCPGWTSVQFDSGRVIGRAVHVNTQHDAVWHGVVPHELSHALLAGHWGYDYIPRWIDEGMAGQVEKGKRIAKSRRAVLDSKDRLFEVESLIEMREYPGRNVGLFYAQSITLVRHLIGRKDKETFKSFVKDSYRHGMKKSLSEHYDLTPEQLKSAWLKSLEEE